MWIICYNSNKYHITLITYVTSRPNPTNATYNVTVKKILNNKNISSMDMAAYMQLQ